MQITLINVKYVRIAVKTTTDTVYPYTRSNKSTKVLNWCSKCLGTVEDITTVDRELPSADNVYVKSFGLGYWIRQMAEIAGGINRPSFRGEPSRLLLNLVIKY